MRGKEGRAQDPLLILCAYCARLLWTRNSEAHAAVEVTFHCVLKGKGGAPSDRGYQWCFVSIQCCVWLVLLRFKRTNKCKS